MLMFFLSVIESEEEKEKFTILYNTWRKDMYYRAYNILSDYDLTEDALQDAFLYIAQNIHKIDDPASIATRSYLLLTTSSQAKKILRDRREIVDSTIVDSYEGVSTEDDFFDQFDLSALIDSIKSLREEFRTPLLLKFAGGHTGAEIAKMLGLSDVAVRKRIERAKKMLNNILEQENTDK